MTAYFYAMRPERWPRSLAIFVGTAAYIFINRNFLHSVNLLGFIALSTMIFLLTWAISTANYILNEIVDVPHDIHHPTKKNRPLVQGKIQKELFIFLGVALTLISLTTAYILFSQAFFVSLLALLIAGFIYNVKPIRTKDIPFLDSISESANNPIRFLIGWFALAPSDAFPPLSLLLCWWAFGNFLMVAKRISEFRLLKDKAGNYRPSLKKYTRSSLFIGLGTSSVVFFSAYFYFAFTFKLLSFFLISPLVCFYFLMFFWTTLNEKEVMEEPERLLKRPVFAIYTILISLGFLMAFLWDKVNQ